MTRETKDTAMVLSALVMLGFAACLTTAGFIIEPTGEIHDSVLWVLGQAFMYAGGIFGVIGYANGKIRHMQENMRRDIDHRFRDLEHGDVPETDTINEEETENDEN